MKKTLTKIAQFANQTNELVGRAVSWLTTALVLLVCYDVAVRYIFKTSQPWIVELEWHFFALIFLLGAGFALKHDRHVRVDLFYAKFSKKDKALTNLVGSLVFLIPWCVLLIFFSTKYAWTSFELNEGSPDPGGLPARYLIKFSVVIGMVLLLLQAIGIVAESILTLQSTSNNE